ncbi:MAG: alpha-mannosyltransferase [Rhodospirillaceae bacterium]|jgi:glycosyltransferase involved in cell wall biosynthesis|uniref:glycosyltransferase family 4 protein n=1 Tax=Hwanghaeella sp. 1Z406 TaxID=3402811 RepID=UPI000C4CF223|nr:alpha-mannosyltransferase [Rhodospirillales bacterium]MAX48153.1 alpha-mannosyltransferase [Rhodospirillaceae bacterium]|tara:strand:+ start:1601 stop:2692 length:1092 start_codon:yes stop_codon:yes gene_type:complete
MNAVTSKNISVTTAQPDISAVPGQRLVIVSDAWLPQINGVVRTLDRTRQEMEKLGLEVHVIGPDRFRTIPCPTYPEIRLAMNALWALPKMLKDLMPAAIHIATEGPLGSAARRFCKKHKHPFSTSFHTRFPEYIHARCGLPVSITYAWMRKFHGDASVTMVTTPTMRTDLDSRNFKNLEIWSRGVDLELFRPRPKDILDFPRPIFMNIGRVAVEKNIGAFLELGLPGTKVVVGGGPQLEELKAAYPDVKFLGPKTGEDLARHYAAADVFVFPSRTDTFGLVLLEALASGVPVAALPVPGPIDVIGDNSCGVLDEDLQRAAMRALEIDPALCRRHAEKFSWEACSLQFLQNLTANQKPKPDQSS